MARTIILLFDSFGIGSTEDADDFDRGANTLKHIAEACYKGQANNKQRNGPLNIPNLTRLGLTLALQEAVPHQEITGLNLVPQAQGWYGYAKELSKGKDTPSGHWEIAGVPYMKDWGYFQPNHPSFPQALIDNLIEQTGIPDILGNIAASGTEIIQHLGEEHIKSGKPIVYTSADSVFQIACHEEHFGLERLYEVCVVARRLVDDYNIGRVIARPFVGKVGEFVRTGNRRDYAVPPPEPTLLEQLIQQQGEVIAIGKIADIFAHQGISQLVKANGNDELFSKTLVAMETAGDKSLIFTNFVDFDSLYGHRRNVTGYAAALEHLDSRLPELEQKLLPDDLVIITADHGCDPTWKGTDHTREHIPIVAFGPKLKERNVGARETFADIGQTIASHLGLKPLKYGTSFYH